MPFLYNVQLIDQSQGAEFPTSFLQHMAVSGYIDVGHVVPLYRALSAIQGLDAVGMGDCFRTGWWRAVSRSHSQVRRLDIKDSCYIRVHCDVSGDGISAPWRTARYIHYDRLYFYDFSYYQLHL